ncbi:hypothetical protein GWI33_001938 [Rhynchophorus ferrugineus]|uniref:Uncharacterized protein n=1 Tax=Rhynchophorus ferrugineus TaxID=354439 RepID=A0A834IRM7_RHYFE|nr:hypothetical protein GWI33_001938 [Rhynchophorus ferrugineus]
MNRASLEIKRDPSFRGMAEPLPLVGSDRRLRSPVYYRKKSILLMMGDVRGAFRTRGGASVNPRIVGERTNETLAAWILLSGSFVMNETCFVCVHVCEAKKVTLPACDCHAAIFKPLQ